MSSLTRLKSLSTKSLSTKVGSKIKKLKQKVLKNAYINKYKRPFIFLLIILSGLTFTFLNLHFRTKEPETIYQVIEPEAPITNDLSFQNIKPNNNLDIKTEKGNIQEDKLLVSISAIEFIQNIKYSPDNTKAIVLSWTSQPNEFIPTQNNTNKVSPTLKLTLINSDSQIQALEEKDITDADFSSNNQIYYHILGSNYGMYAYNIQDGTKRLFIQTSDIESFKNISFIDEDKFFFIQPKSGKYGVGLVSTSELTILGQSVTGMESLNEINVSSISNTFISQDKKNLVVFDNKTYKDQLTQQLLILDPTNIDLSKPTFATDIQASESETAPLNNKYKISDDGNYLTVGSDSTTIELSTRKVVFKGEKNKSTRIQLSPDSSKSIVCVDSNGSGSNCSIKNLKTPSTKEVKLPKDISQMSWLDDETSVFTIGKSIYSFKLKTEKLEKIANDRSEYQILPRNKNTKMLLIKKENNINQLKTKE